MSYECIETRYKLNLYHSILSAIFLLNPLILFLYFIRSLNFLLFLLVVFYPYFSSFFCYLLTRFFCLLVYLLTKKERLCFNLSHKSANTSCKTFRRVNLNDKSNWNTILQ